MKLRDTTRKIISQMEFRFAKDVMLEAQNYYIEHYADETHAALID